MIVGSVAVAYVNPTLIPRASVVPAAPAAASLTAIARPVTLTPPTTYRGDWTQSTFVIYRAGDYTFAWEAVGVDPSGEAAACRIEIRIETLGAGATGDAIRITARDVSAGSTERGSSTLALRGGAYDLTIDGTGCEWTVAVNAA